MPQGSLVSFSDRPPTSADLAPGMTCIPGSGEADFTPLPIHATFSPAFTPDWHERYSPDHVMACWPTEDRPDSPLVQMTWREWSQRVKRAAKYMLQHLHLDEQDTLHPDPVVRKKCWKKGLKDELMPPVIAVVAVSDPQSFRWLDGGCSRAGLVPLLISANNSAETIAHLVSVTNAQAVLTGPAGNAPILDQRVAEALSQLKGEGRDITTIPWPESTVFTDGPSIDTNLPPLPFDGEEPSAILHSSGTTSAHPKPIIMRQTAVRVFQQKSHYAQDPEKAALASAGFVGHLPAAHVFSFGTCMKHAGECLTCAFLPPVNPPPPFKPETALNGMIATKSINPVFAPAMLEMCLRSPAVMEKLQKHYKTVWYGGGPLPAAAAEQLMQCGIRPFNGLASTELPGVSRIDSRASDSMSIGWDELEVAPDAGIGFRPMDDVPGTFEIVGFDKPPYYRPAVYNDTWDGKPIFASGDRCVMLPPGPNGMPRLKCMGRVDAGIVLSTGEKTNPEPIVNIIKSNEKVRDAVMFGQARQHNGVLIELVEPTVITNDQQLADARNVVWPQVEQANKFAPTHSVIYKEMILFTDPARPFQRTGKGSVRFAVTLQAYEKEIDACYEAFEQAAATSLAPPSDWTADATRTYVTGVVAEALRISPDEVPMDADVFQKLGADSLTAAKIRNVLTAALVSTSKGKFTTTSVPSNIVYAHPTVTALSDAVVRLASGVEGDGQSAEERKKELDALIARYSGNWPERVVGESSQDASQHVFLVTGTTGGAGAHFLAQLSRMRSVSKIFAVNRKSNTSSLKTRQEEALRARGEDLAIACDPRVELIEADTSDEATLGLSQELYDRIRTSVTHIIHNAWRLDFNLSVSSFESQIASVRNLALLSIRSPHQVAPRLVFMSSIATTVGWQGSCAVPEEPLEPLISHGGYGQSKAVAEKILESVRAERGIDASTVRSGQLSGSTTNGCWAISDWVPLLFKSAERLGCLPAVAGDTDWLPTDVFVKATLEFALQPTGTPLPFALHVVNPRTLPWSSLLKVVAGLIGPSAASGTKLVPPSEWLDKLEADAAQRGIEQASQDNPAVKLLDFFRGMMMTQPQQQKEEDGGGKGFAVVKLDTTQAQRLSQTLRDSAATSEEEVQRWIQYWREVGFLNKQAAQ